MLLTNAIDISINRVNHFISFERGFDSYKNQCLSLIDKENSDILISSLCKNMSCFVAWYIMLIDIIEYKKVI